MNFETFTVDVSTSENLTRQHIATQDVNGTDESLAKAVSVFRRLAGSADDWPSKMVWEPCEIPSSGRLVVSCAHPDGSTSKQRRLVDRWCEALPSFTGLRHLYFRSRVPQRLFDAACHVPGLETLYIKHSGIKTLEAIENASALTDLALGSSRGVECIKPLLSLKALRCLEIENLLRIKRLDPLASLKELSWLCIMSGMWTTHHVESIAPISELVNLRVLTLAGVRAADRTLSPLFSLKQLEVLRIGKQWDAQEVAELKRLNPGLVVL